MDHAKLDRMYQTIAQTVIEMIPEEWMKVYLYGEVMEGVQRTFFYYFPKASKEPVYFLDIIELFEVNEEEFEQLREQLNDHLKSLWKEFKQSGHEPWSTFMIVFDHTGKFNAEYGYKDLSDPATDFFERRLIWEYKYLGLIPKDDFARRILEEYLKDTEGKSD
ncbi:antitoxin YezG family protein [Polycladomyces sp. WAk]|uniref:Antitoxin YezG family protein n=1 Tax=Polycladomyces zharkentensis TaxID=2807616 RepID=A0ABS2WI26_9BACL|nr:antitoxin YezG family protein [Polycladomyces sp. WAk]MBN2909202.1 antitoxin YezG family protein [Polycladomyces sp. WAk]